ncbi:MAG: FAD-binding oxidoreductase [Anaerolineae bacterium]|nr:FAD-binding oxidoreductase [Anaerolineae bacterium]
MPFNPVTPDLIAQLRAILGDGAVSTAQADLDLHARDQSHHAAHPAEVVIFPTTAGGIADVLRLANEQRIPVTPWGVGTGLEGNSIPVHGGILMSFERMNKIVAVHADDFQVTVQPGIGHKDLNAELTRYGLFFAPDPGANATVGGMLANNAAGIRTVKYGASKDNVPDGSRWRAADRGWPRSVEQSSTTCAPVRRRDARRITEATLKQFPCRRSPSGGHRLPDG